MTRVLVASAVGLLLVAGPAAGATITLTAVQTGGFYADGIPDNFPGFQNYHVGYGTSGGAGRTSERRAFYWFEIPELDGPIVSAALKLTLTFGGLVFGKGPGDPMGPLPSDPTETFQLSGTPFAPTMVTSPGLTPPEWGMVFDSFAGPDLADAVTFGAGAPPPPPDGGIVMPLNGLGLAFLSFAVGDSFILTGYMPSWSEDMRLGPDGEFVEPHELIFGLSDVHAGFPAPTLTIVTSDEVEPAPVPEPGTIGLVGAALAGLIACRRRNSRRGRL